MSACPLRVTMHCELSALQTVGRKRGCGQLADNPFSVGEIAARGAEAKPAGCRSPNSYDGSPCPNEEDIPLRKVCAGTASAETVGTRGEAACWITWQYPVSDHKRTHEQNGERLHTLFACIGESYSGFNVRTVVAPIIIPPPSYTGFDVRAMDSATPHQGSSRRAATAGQLPFARPVCFPADCMAN